MKRGKMLHWSSIAIVFISDRKMRTALLLSSLLSALVSSPLKSLIAAPGELLPLRRQLSTHAEDVEQVICGGSVGRRSNHYWLVEVAQIDDGIEIDCQAR